MQHKRLVNALTKAGLVVKQVEGRPDMFYAEGPKYICEWFETKSYGEGKTDTKASCVCVRHHDDHSDSMSDYHAGTFARTIKLAVEWTSVGVAEANITKAKEALGL